MSGEVSIITEACRIISQNVMKPEISIYHYQDYRLYLKDVIEQRRRERNSYSRRTFAKTIGFASESGLNMVLTNKRELRPPYLDRCIRSLALSTPERIYFEAMVRAGRLTPKKRGVLLKDIEKLSQNWEPPTSCQGIRLLDFFLVQQILCLTSSAMNAEEIKLLFRYPIQTDEIQHILEWMQERDYVTTIGARYKIVKSVMMAKDEVPNTSLRNMHHDAFQFASSILESDPVSDREFQTYLFTVNRKKIPELKQKVKRLVLEVISEYETEATADSVIQMHFHLLEAIDKKNLAILRQED